MSYSPYIPNITAWKDHFKRATKEHKKFYTISHVKQLGEKLEAIKLVTPTESVVERARSTVRRMRADGDAQFLLPSQPQRRSQKRKSQALKVEKSSDKKKRQKKKITI